MKRVTLAQATWVVLLCRVRVVAAQVPTLCWLGNCALHTGRHPTVESVDKRTCGRHACAAQLLAVHVLHTLTPSVLHMALLLSKSTLRKTTSGNCSMSFNSCSKEHRRNPHQRVTEYHICWHVCCIETGNWCCKTRRAVCNMQTWAEDVDMQEMQDSCHTARDGPKPFAATGVRPRNPQAAAHFGVECSAGTTPLAIEVHDDQVVTSISLYNSSQPGSKTSKGFLKVWT